MNKVLVLSGHPALDASRANRLILGDLEAAPGLSVVVRRLDRLYPDYRIDVAAEQSALGAADTVVWQFPLYWYGLPALMKKWVEDVLVYGFAHGTGGDRLRGKRLILSFTTGAPAAAYAHGQAMGFPIEDFLPPLRQIATLCGMELLAPIHSSGMTYFPGVHTDADRAAQEARAHDHTDRLIAALRQTMARQAA